MPNRCIIAGCSNLTNIAEGITLFSIPFANDNRTEAKRRRRLWVEFVRRNRAQWKPTPYSSICSVHFSRDDFVPRYHFIPGQSQALIRRLIKDQVGIKAIPKFLNEATNPEFQPLSERSRRKIIRDAMASINNPDPTTLVSVAATASEISDEICIKVKKEPIDEDELSVICPAEQATDAIFEEGVINDTKKKEDFKKSSLESSSVSTCTLPQTPLNKDAMVQCSPQIKDRFTQCYTSKCAECKYLLNQNRILKNRIITYQIKLADIKKKKRKVNP